jgi:hypothetical protein
MVTGTSLDGIIDDLTPFNTLKTLLQTIGRALVFQPSLGDWCVSLPAPSILVTNQCVGRLSSLVAYYKSAHENCISMAHLP